MNPKKYFTIEEIVSIPSLGSVTVSDDGRKVAYVSRTANWDENSFENHVWIYDNQSESTNPITLGKIESSSPAWSPSSQHIAYLSAVGEKEEKKLQIFIKPATGYKEEIQISQAEESVEKFKWSPDGKGLFYIAKSPKPESAKMRKEIYGDYEHVDHEYQKGILYYVELPESLERKEAALSMPKDLRKRQEAAALTDGHAYDVSYFDISPDGSKVAFVAAPTPNSEDRANQELYLLDWGTKQITVLDAHKPLSGEVHFSPDGSQIAYIRFLNEGKWYNNITLDIFDINTGGIAERSIPIDENAYPVRWTEAGIVFQWQERTNGYIGLLTNEGEFQRLVDGENCFAHSASVSKNGRALAYLKATSEQPVEVFLNSQKITNQGQIYEQNTLSQKSVVRWRSEDGLEIEGVLSTPPDFDPANKYPLLVCIHGGPTAASYAIPTNNKYYPIEQFVEKGFIVLEPNYRGSSGYGEAFRKANFRNMGTGDYADVISGVDALIERGFVDGDRVGVMGWSQGGYISAFCTTYSSRFKAVSVGAGISNWVTYYVNTDIHPFTRYYLGDNPWNDEAIYKKTSPVTYIKSACTPTLIQHGDQDARVPVPNAYELYQGLRDMGVETELVIFKGMGHGSNKPGLNRAIMKQNLLWFSHFLLGESLDGFRG